MRACRGDEAPAAPSAPAETLDQTTALKRVLKAALAHDGLCRGLHEVCRCGALHHFSFQNAEHLLASLS